MLQLWVDRITQTWVHCSKFTGRSIRARNLEDSLIHSQQHLLQENAALRQSLEELTRQQALPLSHSSMIDRSVLCLGTLQRMQLFFSCVAHEHIIN